MAFKVVAASLINNAPQQRVLFVRDGERVVIIGG
jgi:hypothetical protein